MITEILSSLWATPLVALPLITVLLSLLMTLVYKWMTDQTQMKLLREDLKKYQKQLKENKDDTDKLLDLQKKVMDINLQYMMQSLKPMAVTMLPVLLVFSWLSGHYAYEPLYPGQDFSVDVLAAPGITGNVLLDAPELTVDQGEKELVDGKASWKVRGKEGEYFLSIKTQGNEYNQEVLITPQQKYIAPQTKISDGVLDTISVQMKPLTVLSLFGWELGWLGTYILFSVVFTIMWRKLLDVQ